MLAPDPLFPLNTTKTGEATWQLTGTVASGDVGTIYTYLMTLQDAMGSALWGPIIQVVGSTGAVITSSTPHTAYIGKDYNYVLAATGGHAPYTWSAAGLPDWLSIVADSQGTRIEGSVPQDEVPGAEYAVTLEVQTFTSPVLTTELDVTLHVALPIQFTGGDLPTAVLGEEYDATLEISGGIAPYVWSATGLPEGLTLETDGSTTATISGKVAKTATTGATTLHLTVKDASQPQTTLDIDVPLIVARPVTLATALLPTAISGETYDLTLSAFGGVAPYTWSATGLPPGLSMSASGAIAGETALGDEGSYVVNVTITDSSTPPLVGLDKRLLIVDEEYVQLAITTTSLPVAAVGDVYGSGILVATGAESLKNLVWTAFGLPDGLELIQGNDGQWSIEGTPAPATSGVYSVQVTVTDSVLKQSASAIYPLFVEDDGDDEIVPPDPSAVVAQPSLVGVAAGACALGVSEDSTTQRIAIIAAIVAALVGSHLSRSSRRDE